MSGMRIGYHYTSQQCWEKIQIDGLHPYSISKQNLVPYIRNDTIHGIWIWQNRMYGLSHIGSIIYQNATKNTLEVVFLEVQYDIDDCLSPIGQPNELITVPHFGTIEKLEYHGGADTAVIVTVSIPPMNINLLKTYNLLDAWKE